MPSAIWPPFYKCFNVPVHRHHRGGLGRWCPKSCRTSCARVDQQNGFTNQPASEQSHQPSPGELRTGPGAAASRKCLARNHPPVKAMLQEVPLSTGATSTTTKATDSLAHDAPVDDAALVHVGPQVVVRLHPHPNHLIFFGMVRSSSLLSVESVFVNLPTTTNNSNNNLHLHPEFVK